MSTPVDSIQADQRARDLALDPSQSIALQAPAGSGKTTVLTQRILALLAVVGAAVMLFNWIVINFVISGLHSYA